MVVGNPNLNPTYRDYFYLGFNFLENFTISGYYSNYDGDIVELPRQNNNTNIIAYTPTNLEKKVEYGFFGVTGLVIFFLMSYALA